MTRGLPASGKSTWAKEQCEKHPGIFKIVCKDDLRNMLDCGKWSPNNEKYILKVRDVLIEHALEAGFSVIVSDTNFHTKHEARLRQLAKEYKAEFELKDFDTPLAVCIERDRIRPNSVGEVKIREMYTQFQKPEVPKIVMDDNLPRAIICDLDGTLALLNGRDPYQPELCEDDLLDTTINGLLHTYRTAGYTIILCSGRHDGARPQTEAWLEKHGVKYDHLFMRPEGNQERDRIVKEKILREEILPKYKPLFVLDDRDQVVEMWRELGLKCLQVAPGNF